MLINACCLLAASPDSSSLSQATWFLGLLLALLIVFFVTIALLTMKRSFDRRRAIDRTHDDTTPDPWQEAGKRVQPYEPKRDR